MAVATIVEASPALAGRRMVLLDLAKLRKAAIYSRATVSEAASSPLLSDSARACFVRASACPA